MRLFKSFFAMTMVVLTVSACAGFAEYPAGPGQTASRPYIGTDPITVESTPYVFFTQLFQGKPWKDRDDTVIVYREYPEGYDPEKTYPAVVLMHGSGGIDTRVRDYRDQFTEAGYIVYMPMSFAGRNWDREDAKAVLKTTKDQFAVTDVMVIADAYAVLDAAWKDPSVDNSRIGVMGWSKGGTVALYTALEQIRGHLAKEAEQKFAFHVAMYPFCGYYPLDRTTTGAPIDIHIGEQDDLTPPERCERWHREYLATGQTNESFYLYPYATHMFDHRKVRQMQPTSVYTVTAYKPGPCRFVEREPGRFFEETSGTGTFTKEDAHKMFYTSEVCTGEGPVHIKSPPWDVYEAAKERIDARVEQFAD